jgi:hypothetical protein
LVEVSKATDPKATDAVEVKVATAAVPVPESAKLVPVPLLAATVRVSALLPRVAGLKVIVPVVHELPEAIVELAVQVPKGAVKSVLSVALKGVADKVTGPPEAVKVIVPVLQVAEEPAAKLPQAREVGDATSVPKTPVPETVAETAVAELALVMVVLFKPAEVGVKVTCPVVHVLPALITKLAVQVPSVPENSASEFVNGAAPNVMEPPFAVKVSVPQLPVVLMPCVAEQESEVGLTVRYAFAVPVRPKVVPVPLAALTVTVSERAPAVLGLNVMVPVVQWLPAAMVEFAVQVPKPTVKSVESELENGVADKITSALEAVRVMAPVQVLLEPALTAGQVTVPEAARAP